MQPAVIFFCHGAREAAWRLPFDRIVAEFRQRRPELRAELAFLEIMSPDLPQTIDSLAAAGFHDIRVVLLFLAPGGHTRRDVALLLDAARTRWPALHVEATDTLTEAPAIRGAIVDWALDRLAGK